MIVKALLELLYTLLGAVFGTFSIPSLPAWTTNMLNDLKTYMLQGFSILGCFVNLSHFKLFLPLVIVLCNFEKAWRFVMFILRKIPFVGIE